VRVAHVISTLDRVGGAERIVEALVDGGKARGATQVVLNPFAAEAVREPPLAAVLADSDFRYRTARGLRDIPALRSWLTRQLKEFDADLVHVHLFHAAVAMGTIGRARERRIFTHHHGDTLRFQGRRWAERLDRWAGSRFDRVVAVSDAVRTFLVEEYGYPEDGAVTIRNGWKGTPLAKTPSANGPRIICAAHLRREKGHAVLLRAFALVREEIPDARLVLLGDGELRGELERQARDLDLGESVVFAGIVDDVWRWLAQSDVFVLPSLVEPLGIVVMEALAAGVPVVGSDVGGIPELITEGVTGDLVPPGDAETLATAVTTLLRDEDRLRSMGMRARESAEPMRMEHMVQSYFDLYSETLRVSS